ncbi:MAG: hypothetical protein WCS65_06725 [Verrucomicrobiae bacterium]
MSDYKANLEQSIERQEAYWSGTLQAGPLVTIWLPDATPQGDAWQLEAEERRLLDKRTLLDDAIPTVEIQTESHTFSALVGSAIQEVSGTFWVEPLLKDLRHIGEVALRKEAPFYQMITERIALAAAKADGRYAIRGITTPGISDVIDGVFGTENTLMAMMEEPEGVKDLAARCGKILKEFLRIQFGMIPLFHGGANAGLAWMPGRGMTLSADLMVMCSASQFDEFIAPVERELISDLDGAIYHVHSTGLRIVDSLLEMEKVAAIEISHDPNGPEISDMGETLKKIAERKKLILTGWSREFKQTDLEWLQKNTDKNRLSLYFQGGTVGRGNEIVSQVREFFR